MERLALFFFAVIAFNHQCVSGTNSTTYSAFAERNVSPQNRIQECSVCIRRVATYFSVTVKDPRQFCIDNEICPKTSEPSSYPTGVPSSVPTAVPSPFPSDAPSSKPTSRPSLLPSDGPSLIPSNVPTRAPSSLPSDGPSLLPSSGPTPQPSLTQSFGPSDVSSGTPTSIPTIDSSPMPSVVSSDSPSWSFEPSFSPTRIPSVEPTISPTISSILSDVSSIEPTSIIGEANSRFDYTKQPSSIFLRDVSTGVPSHQPTLHQSLPATTVDVESVITTTDLWRTTISSLYMKRIASPMSPEITQIFSSTVLQFLKKYSLLIDKTGTVDFIDVEVVGQGPEFGNSTGLDSHIDGMHIYFETIIAITGNDNVDLPWLIETIFKTNRNAFYLMLIESNKFFAALSVEGHNTQEKEVESLRAYNSDFMNSWVIASLAIVVCSVFITIMLMTRMVQGANNKPNGFEQDTPKSAKHPFFALDNGSISSEISIKSNDKKRRRTDHMTHVHDGSNSIDILKDLGDESLAGLRLLRNQSDSSSTYEYSKEYVENKQEDLNTDTDTDTNEFDDIPPGQHARTRWQKPNQDNQIDGAKGGTSLETILKATSSFNTEEDGGCQNQEVLGVEVVSGDYESQGENILPTTSIMKRISGLFSGKRNKQSVGHLEPVRIMEEGESVLSYPSTPARSIDDVSNPFLQLSIGDMSNEGADLSISTNDALPAGDKYNNPTDRSSAFSPIIFSPKPLSVDTSNPQKQRPDSIKTAFLSSPISRRLLRRAKTQEMNQSPESQGISKRIQYD